MRMSRWAAIPDAAEAPPRPAWVPAGAARRMDPLTRLACAVIDQLLLAGPLPAGCGLVFHTAFGSVDSTQRFLDSMATFGDQAASPTPFTSSVHNATVGAIAELLRLHGPSVTISNWTAPGLTALACGRRLVGSGRVGAALVLCGECHTQWSRSMVSTLLRGRRQVASGLWAALLEDGPGPGRPLTWGEDAGALIIAEEGAWWPGCVLSRIPWSKAGSFVVREGSQQVGFGAALAAVGSSDPPPTGAPCAPT